MLYNENSFDPFHSSGCNLRHKKGINEADFSKQMKDENIILLYCGYQDILKSQNAIDFDDLLLKVYGLFVHPV
jgi:superfamily I DNA/RNA helicase